MIKKLLVAALLLITSNISMADSVNNAILRVDTSNQYMVSAVLRKNDGDVTVKLVQSLEKANSKDEAIGLLFKRIQKEFVGYSVLDSLVMLVPIKNKCDSWI